MAGVSQNGDSLSIPSDRARTLVVRFLPLDLHFALDAEELEWETGGDAFWIPQRTVSHDGHDAAFAESVITDDEDVWLATRVFGSGKFNFFLKSGEFLGDFSGIDLFVDGQWVDELSGFEAFDWKPFSVDVKGNGEHTIAFSVWTDGTAPSRSVWIDQVSWMTEGGGTTTETPVPVPYTWLEKYGLGADGDYNSAANGKAANGQAVWACYEAGLDPTDPNARLRARIEMREGRAVISWEPDLGAERVYRVEGAEALGKPWKSPPEAKDRFFRVKVRLP